jgi:CPA2 family monovalent cation:H+ antiporter-2
MVEPTNLKIVIILTVGLGFAAILGYLAHLIKLSPIIGFLAAGYLIGPYSPGFVADLQIAEQLAQLGVILMMFSAGLHFKWQDLMQYRSIALPGSIIQTAVATLVGVIVLHLFGWTLQSGIIIGLAIGVASTIVLVRLLTENKLLTTPEGYLSVAWLIVEDLITVFTLLLLPFFVLANEVDAFPYQDLALAVLLILVKFAVLIAFLFTVGKWVIPYILSIVLKTNSHELFTLTILSLTFSIATISTFVLGASIAFGAFIAGMLIGQAKMHHQIALHAYPLRDVFVVVFFLSVGMLFDPNGIGDHLPLFLALLAIILLIKPITAFTIAIAFKQPLRTALTLAISLAQVGEFSFILTEEAMNYDILPYAGYDLIVACAIISIALNPLLFQLLKYLKLKPE